MPTPSPLPCALSLCPARRKRMFDKFFVSFFIFISFCAVALITVDNWQPDWTVLDWKAQHKAQHKAQIPHLKLNPTGPLNLSVSLPYHISIPLTPLANSRSCFGCSSSHCPCAQHFNLVMFHSQSQRECSSCPPPLLLPLHAWTSSSLLALSALGSA